MTEEWRPLVGVPEVEGLYQISNMGRVRRIVFTHKLQKEYPSITKQRSGYMYVMLTYGKYKCCRLHRLVAMAFLPNPNNYDEVNHIDGDKTHNSLDNLEWSNRSQNVIHSYRVLHRDPVINHWTEEEKKRIGDSMRESWKKRKSNF